MLLFKIGFRNLLRNKRRAALTSIVISLGMASFIIMDGFIVGMNENMIKTLTNGLVGEGQIHHKKFQTSFKVEQTLEKLRVVETILSTEANIKAYTKRLLSFAMISSPKNTKNVTLVGINPDTENKVSNTYKYLKEGRFIQYERDLVIGAKLLGKLELELGDKLIITTAQAETGEISQELFRITGVIKSGDKLLDEQMIFTHHRKAMKMLNLEGKYHEISFKFYDREQGPKLEKFWTSLNRIGNNKADSWKDLAKGFVSMMRMIEESKGIIALTLMLLVGIGIVNTLFMSLYERSFEFAVLKALGTKKLQVVLIILSESLALAIYSVFLGFVFSFIFGGMLAYWGIDYGNMEFAEVTLQEPIYYVFVLKHYIYYPIVTFIFTVFISLYPAITTARANMSETLKRTL